MTDPLDELARRVGLEPWYTDAFGQPRTASRASVAATLAALGYGGDSEAALAERKRNEARALLAPVTVTRVENGPPEAAVAVPGGTKRLHWRLETEAGEVSATEAAITDLREGADGRYRLQLPDLPLGYHRLEITVGDRQARQTVIVAPSKCYMPPALEGGRRTWGFGVQLYTLRSERNWGVGDFGDLDRLVELGRGFGAGVLALNPLHANFLDEPEHASPYSPSSRRHFNPLYLDIEAIPDFADSREARLRLAEPAFQAELADLRATDWVDYQGVAAAKRPVLELLYRHFRLHHLDSGETDRGADFRAFQAAGGRSLWAFCVFHALRESFAAEDTSLRDWRRWPEAYREPDSQAVADFAAANTEAVAFHAYLQWQAEAQLDRVRDKCAGMPIGLMTDLALGADAAGAGAWSAQGLYVTGVSLGAPPDELNLLGQNWGLPPMNPLALRACGYSAFVEVLRANMRHAGAIRIDHVLGLMRQYWVPAGFPASDGVYLRFPFEDMLGVLALESQRQQCLVIGEDLGTVPEGLRERLRAAGVLSYRLLLFERSDAGGFLAPEAYPREALVAATTHDLPTLPAYWQGADLALRQRLGLYPDTATYSAESQRRDSDLSRLTSALRRQGLDTEDDVSVPVLACYAFLARTPSAILQVQMEDLLGETAPLNVPGTSSEYPNWRRKLRLELDDLAALPSLHALAAEIRRVRGPERATPAPADVWMPRATYRLQLNAGFDFDAAADLADYLGDLGVSHVYASPYLRARRGSPHGYDVVDHGSLNAEIGDDAALDRFVAALSRRGLGQILDFVSNHAGIGQADNAAWLDVLRWGRISPHAPFFDIDWQPAKPELQDRVLLPFLGEHYGVVLLAGDLVPRFDSESGSFDIWYHEHRFPIAPTDYAALIDAGLSGGEQGEAATGLYTFVEAFRALGAGAESRPETRRRGEAYRTALRHLVQVHPAAGEVLHRGAAVYAGTPGDNESFQALHDLLERQAYRVAYWRVAASEINYRRFFDINELAAIRVEDPPVFDRVHRLVARLVAEGRLHGLRIDHIDGLYDPADYLADLRALLKCMRSPAGKAPAPYTVVEKILEPGEALPRDWACDGTTGYDFMNQVLGVFVDPSGKAVLDRVHADLGGERDFTAVLYRVRHQVVRDLFSGELESLTTALDRLAEQSWTTRDYTRQGLHAALAELTARFPVYRTYVSAGRGCRPEDRDLIVRTCGEAKAQWPGPDREVFDFLCAVLTGDLAADGSYDADAVMAIAQRFQQFTGPVMAKSLEDTAFYRHFRLTALNEVGGDPGRFGFSPDAFHAANSVRAVDWPHTMLATATHDNKRGEDVRMRLAVLSELADDWALAVTRWTQLNARLSEEMPGGSRPAELDIYLLYQTLVGAWPVELLNGDLRACRDALAAFAERVRGYMIKAVREAKLHSRWTAPDEAYEGAISQLVTRLLDPSSSDTFLSELQVFSRRIAWLGALNSMAQTVLKLTSPGVPDIYQGAELWDLNLVDPDNRRPVEFERRSALLADIRAERAPREVAALLADWPDGRIKLHVLHRLLHLRGAAPEIFADGDYEPLPVQGREAARVLAFRRTAGDREVIVIAGRLLAGLYDEGAAAGWGDTYVEAPVTGALRDHLTGARLRVPKSGRIRLQKAFDIMPCAVFTPPR